MVVLVLTIFVIDHVVVPVMYRDSLLVRAPDL